MKAKQVKVRLTLAEAKALDAVLENGWDGGGFEEWLRDAKGYKAVSAVKNAFEKWRSALSQAGAYDGAKR